MIDLIHYSAKPLSLRQEEVAQPNSPKCSLGKPYGLWVSTPGEDDWPSWCRSEEFGLDRLRYETKIRISDESRFLIIEDVQSLRSLTKRYICIVCRREFDRLGHINWKLVAAEYDGIIISPYQWECRLHETTDWYYGWDCASGCIWRFNAVEAEESQMPSLTSAST